MGWETKHEDPGLNNISSTRDQFKKITETGYHVIMLYNNSGVPL